VLYIDTSSLFKLLWQETQSEWTRQRIAAEQKVVLSSLAELEADVQLVGACLAGKFSRAKLSAYRRALSAFAEIESFERADLPGQLFYVALRQQRRVSEPHCGTLDRSAPRCNGMVGPFAPLDTRSPASAGSASVGF